MYNILSCGGLLKFFARWSQIRSAWSVPMFHVDCNNTEECVVALINICYVVIILHYA